MIAHFGHAEGDDLRRQFTGFRFASIRLRINSSYGVPQPGLRPELPTAMPNEVPTDVYYVFDGQLSWDSNPPGRIRLVSDR